MMFALYNVDMRYIGEQLGKNFAMSYYVRKVIMGEWKNAYRGCIKECKF